MNIGVSICCTCYNQEKYISQCLDGFLSQKTSFPFEIIIHDDASTDHTADIIRQYQQKYPDIIFPILQKDNQYSKNIRIGAQWIYPQARGKYIARCEGDDFWCEPNKLQIQFDALEKHPECNLCVTKVQAVSEPGNKLKKYYPNQVIHSGVLEQEEFIRYCLEDFNFHLSSFFFRRNVQLNYIANTPEYVFLFPVGDLADLLYYGHVGKVYYINSIMSCYRLQALGSWTTRQRTVSIAQKILMLHRFNEAIASYDNYTLHRFQLICENYKLKNDFKC